MGDPIGVTGLQFFGAMMASISHEIKNRMAIINEQAGLLSDFVHMAENGKPLDPQRLERLADAVKTQVSLADGIIKNMNQFAHSVDNMRKSLDLEETLIFMAELFKRRTGNSGIRLNVRTPKEPLTVETSPFLLMNLIWSCLLPLLSEKHADQLLILDCEKHNGGFHINMIFDAQEDTTGFALSKTPKVLAEALEAKLLLSEDTKKLRIELPARPSDVSIA